MRRPRVSCLCILIAVLVFTTRAAAQPSSGASKPPGDSGKVPSGPARSVYFYGGAPHATPPPDWGTTERSWSRLGATELAPDESSTTFTSTWQPESSTFTYQRYVIGGFPHLIGFAHLPAGALVSSLNTQYCEDNGSGPFGSVNV